MYTEEIKKKLHEAAVNECAAEAANVINLIKQVYNFNKGVRVLIVSAMSCIEGARLLKGEEAAKELEEFMECAKIIAREKLQEEKNKGNMSNK